jgi:hemoglobin/transferrin/lactoferrin receptor protein
MFALNFLLSYFFKNNFMKKITLFCLSVIISMNLGAQNISDTTLSNKTVQINEIVISANKTEENKSEIPYEIEVIRSKDIVLNNPQSSADMLINTGSIFVQKSQQGGGSPALRGFESSRVLIVVDGVRMNNAIYRLGHLQDIITLDNSMLDHTEVIFGPSSTIYGSDALGGVMHFYTKKPLFGEDKMRLKGNSYVRWSSVNNEMTGHLDLNFGWKKIASLTSFTYSKFGDLRSGNMRDDVYDSYFSRDYYVETINGVDSMIKNSDRNIQKFSGYSQYDILQKFAFKQNANILHTLNFQFSNSTNIPRYDRLTEYGGENLRYAEWYYGPQTRLLASLNTQITSDGKLYNKLNIILAGQSISQDRINRRFGNDNKRFQMEDVLVYSLNADFVKFVKVKHEIRYGLEGIFNDVKSEAKNVNIETNVETPYQTRYPDGGSTMSSYAAYLSHKWRVSEKFIISDGIRFSASALHSKFVDTTFFPFPFKEISQKNNALTGNIGFVVKPTPSWKISLLGSTGFRTPNVDDLTKIFDSSPGTLIVANPDLKPENAYNAELGIEKIFDESVKISVVGWYTKLVNAMVVKNYTYNGQDSVMYDGTMSRVQAVQNADNGNIKGITGTFMADFNEHFSFMSTATYTYGRYHDAENDTIVPLDHISPVFGKTALIYRSKKIQAEVYALYNGWKKLKDYSSSGEDNLQYATPYGMPSWITLNMKMSWQMTKNIMLQTGLENILDTHYRYFASGISAPGRNLVITLRGTF